MFDKNRNRHDQHNYQSVTVAVDSPVSAIAGLIVALVTVSLIIGAVVVVAFVVGQVATGLLAGITTIATTAINGLATIITAIVAILPWLAGCGAIVFLVMVALRSIPQAIAEVEEIRYRRMLAMNSARMLEVRDVDHVVVLRPVRSIATIDAE